MVVLRELLPESNYYAVLVFVIPMLLTVITALGLVICDNHQGCGGRVWKENIWGEVDINGFCEQDRTDRFLSEQQNTLSNLGFIYFGFVIYAIMIHDIFIEEDGIQSHITVTPILSFIYGCGMFYLGFGSFIFHGHPTDITYAHDQASILVMFVVLIGYSLFLFIRLDNLRDKWIILTLTMIGVIIMLQRNISQSLDITLAENLYFIFIGILVFIHLINAGYRYYIEFFIFSFKNIVLIVSVVVFFIMALMVQEEFVPVKCTPHSRFQKHALWHVFCSMGFFVLYLFNRADDRRVWDNFQEKHVEDQHTL